MKKFIMYLLLVIVFTSIFVPTVKGEDFVILNNIQVAKVVRIIDGDSIVVRTGSNEVALVRLIGADAKGSNDALKYLTLVLLGEIVILQPDDSFENNNRWNFMYVYKDNLLINQEILSRGLANFTDHNNANLQINSLDTTSTIDKNITSYSVNINTATSTQIRRILSEINSSIATNIVSYRERNPFNTVEEIKFVNGITSNILEKNAHIMRISTNINISTREELETLGLSPREVDRIIDYRHKNSFNNISDLYTNNLISRSSFNRLENFISVVDVDKINISIPDFVVNINTATENQIRKTGLTRAQTNNIIENRNKYSYKTLGELNKFSRSPFTNDSINSFADNLTLRTDINNATLNEIESLVNSYNEAYLIYNNRPYSNIDEIKIYIDDDVYDNIKNFIFVDNDSSSFININTATYDELLNLGFTPVEAREIQNNRVINQGNRIPVNTVELDYRVSLYTNINMATKEELFSLGFNSKMIDDIINYRDNQPFGNIRHLEDILNLSDRRILTRVREFIVFR